MELLREIGARCEEGWELFILELHLFSFSCHLGFCNNGMVIGAILILVKLAMERGLIELQLSWGFKASSGVDHWSKEESKFGVGASHLKGKVTTS
jgi:hypothetical protein